MAGADNLRNKKAMQESYILELLEPRIMLSADPFGAAEVAVDLLLGEQDEVAYKVIAPAIAPSTELEPLDIASVTTLFASQDLLSDSLYSNLQPEDGAFVSVFENETARIELIIIDSAVSNQQQLLQQIIPPDSHVNYQIHYLDQDSEGINQISELLNQYSQVDAVHILSHGKSDGVQLGSAWVNTETLNQQAEQITQWSSILTDDADILLYGCDVTSSEAGMNFVQALQRLTGADIAASDDKTGAQSLGGDWDLEYSAGEIETGVVTDAAAQQVWSNVLGTINVTTTLDVVSADADLTSLAALAITPGSDGFVSLREAIIAANTDTVSGLDQINLGAGTYSLTIAFGGGENLSTEGDLDINDALVIRGDSAATTIIDGDIPNERVFDIRTPGADISNLTITNGGNTATLGGGLRVTSGSDVALTDVVISNNQGDDGAGIFNLLGTVTLSRVVFDGNIADGSGGAIVNEDGVITGTDVSFISNTAAGNGGAIDNSGNITLDRALFYDNTAALGGAIYNEESVVNLTNTTLSANTATTDGGAIYNIDKLLAPGTINLTNSTLTGNTSPGVNGIAQANSIINLKNSILNDGVSNISGGTVNSLDYNIDSDGSAGLGGLNDMVGDPLLGALQDNGGPTFTHALLAGSLAIDAGNNTGAPAVDQRGLTRIGTVDIGAYELESLSLLLSTNGSATYDDGAVGIGEDIVAFIDPNLNLELGDGSSGVTDGTFSVEHSLPENVRAMHYVNSVVTVDTNTIAGGLGTYELQPGQIVLSMRAGSDFTVPTLAGGTLTVNNTDILVFTPSTGTYEMLLEDAILKSDLSAANIHAITIVEQATTIGVDTTLAAGTYLIARSDPAVHSDISTYDNTNGRQDLLLGADFLSDPEHIQGLELLEAELIVGSTTLAQGTLLISISTDMTVGTSGGTTVSGENTDIIALTVNATEQDSGTPDTDVDAQIVFDGSDVSLSVTGAAEINGLTILGNNLSAINDAPVMSASATNPNFIEGVAAVNLFSSAMVDTIESGQSLIGMELTVTNVSGTADEVITIDGSGITLTNGNSGTTAGSSLNYNVSVSGSLATVTISAAPGVVDESAAQNLVDAISYQNVSDDPGSSDRVITITELKDSGGTANSGDDTAALSIASTVTVTPVNDEPVVTATALDPTFNEGGAAVSIFTASSVDPIEAGQNLIGIWISVTNVTDGSDEVVTFDGSSIVLTDGSSGNTTNFSYSVSTILGAKVIALTAGSVTPAVLEGLIDNITYQNNSSTPTEATRTIAISGLKDDGGTADFNLLWVNSDVVVTAVDNTPTISNNSLSLNQGGIVTISSLDLAATDTETSDALLTFNIVTINNGYFALSADTSSAITSFTQAQITAGDVVFVHDGGELAPTYDLTVSDGIISSASSNAIITFSGTPEGVLWLSTDGNESTSNGIPGLNSSNVDRGDILQQAGPNFAMGQGSTDGTFSIAFDISLFSSDDKINGLHYVTSNITIGQGNVVNLQVGDVLLTSSGSMALTSNGVSAPAPGAVQKEDIFYFRPDTPGDYSKGNFYLLFTDGMGTGAEIQAITLVEKNVTVGDYLLEAGDILFGRDGGNEKNDIWLFRTAAIDMAAASSTYPTALKLIEGDNAGAGFDDKIFGLDVLESDLVIGGKTYDAGTVLVSFDKDDSSVGTNSKSVTKHDVVALNVSQTTLGVLGLELGFAQLEASILFDGSGVGFDSGNETLDGFSLTFDQVSTNTPPSLDSNNFVFTEGVTTTITPAMLSASDLEDADAGLGFDISLLTGGQFELASNAGVAITSFTQNQVATADVVFVDNGDETAPTFSLSVSDGANTTAAVAATINFSNSNDDPTLNNAIIDQNATEDSAFSFTFAANSFGDVDVGDTLTYSATLSGGAALPSWLSFDGATRTFSGTPLNGDVGTLTIEITADDSNGGTPATDQFALAIANSNDDPTLNNALIDQNATQDTAFSYTFAANSFGDVDVGDTLTYSATLSSGAALPSWLSFDGATRTFSGTPLNGDVGTLTVDVIADDGNGGTPATDSFDLVIANSNDDPTLNNALIDQNATQDTAFSYTFAAGSFGDVDVGDTLTYSATLSGGAALPSWLTFDNATRTFSGTPLNADVGTLTIDVIADDGNGGTPATDQFDLVIANSNDDPTLNNAIIDQNATQDSAFSFTFAANSFGDVDVGDTLTYSATLSSGAALPSWLNFDNATRTFSGTPLNADVGTLTIDVIADDGNGGTPATDGFSLVITNTNDLPGGSITIASDGSPAENVVLSVIDTLTDEDGLGTITYHWLRNGTDIGSIGSTYTLVDVDIGQTITVEARYIDMSGVAERLSSVPLHVDVTPIEIIPTVVVSATAPVLSESVEDPEAEEVVEDVISDIETVVAPAVKVVAVTPEELEAFVEPEIPNFTIEDVKPNQVIKPLALAIGNQTSIVTDLKANWAQLSDPLLLVNSSGFMDGLDEAEKAFQKQMSLDQMVVGSGIAMSTGLSIGYVTWLIRSGVLLSSVLTSLPAWRFVDPLPILSKMDGADLYDDEEDSLEELVQKEAAEDESMSKDP